LQASCVTGHVGLPCWPLNSGVSVRPGSAPRSFLTEAGC
jgi:hypothetical protein